MKQKVISELSEKLIFGFEEDEKLGQVFISYFGHVNEVRVSIHLPKWRPSSNPDFTSNIYFKEDLCNIGEEIESLNNFIESVNSKYRIEL